MPPRHLWSVRAAVREGARSLEDASLLTGLPEEALREAWEYVNGGPVE